MAMDFEQRVKLTEDIIHLKRAVEAGTISFGDVPRLRDDLLNLRFLGDGLIDETTVTSSIRTLLMTYRLVESHPRLTSGQLRQLYENYFETVRQLFGSIHSDWKARDVTISRFANGIEWSSDYSDLEDELLNLRNSLTEFWQQAGPAVTMYARSMRTTKGVYGGATFPVSDRGTVKGLGVYLDTLVLPDPILKVLGMVGFSQCEDVMRRLVRFAIELLELEPLVMADLDIPLVLLVPEEFAYSDEAKATISRLGGTDALRHAEVVFGKKFSSEHEAINFLKGLRTWDQVEAEVVERTRLLFATEYGESVRAQLEEHRRTTVSDVPMLEEFSMGELAYFGFAGKYGQVNDLLVKTVKIDGVPVLDVDTPWQYLLWKYESQTAPGPVSADSVLSYTLATSGEKPVRLLREMPVETLLKIRKEGIAEPIRELIREGIGEAAAVEVEDAHDLAAKVEDNLRRALVRHYDDLDSIESDFISFGLKDVGRFVGFSSVSIALAFAHHPLLGVLGALGSMIGVPTIGDLRAKHAQLKEGADAKLRAPSSILFAHSERKDDLPIGWIPTRPTL